MLQLNSEQGCAYKACNCRHTPPHTTKISKMFYITSYIMKTSFGCAVYCMSKFKRFSNFKITKRLLKQNIVFNFTAYFIQKKAPIFSLNYTKQNKTNA